MADSVSQVPKSHDKSKYVNSVNRTTSETLRLADSEKGIVQPTSLNVTASNLKKKTTSFQITSVTVGSRMSNDGGDDSADDLDESHTDDVSEINDTSRATDIERETPSYSEDTFSKDDVFFNASTGPHLAPAPVIPTSSQYGLAILDSSEAGEAVNSSEVCSNMPDSELGVVTEKVINLVSSKHDAEVRDSPHSHTTRSERFKVVKIESTEPFKRGRWVCMDYLDHTVSQPTNPESTDSPSQTEPTNEVKNTTTLGHEESHPTESSNTISATTQIDSSQISSSQPMNTLYTSSPGQSLQSSIQVNTITNPAPQVTHGQSLSQINVPHSVPNHTSLQPQQIQQVVASANSVHPGSSLPQQIPQPIQPQIQPPFQQQQQQQFLQQQQQAAVLQQQQSAVLQQQQLAAQQQQMAAQQQQPQQFSAPQAHSMPMTGLPSMAFPTATPMVHQAFVPPTQYYPATASTGIFVPAATIIPGTGYAAPVLTTVPQSQPSAVPGQTTQQPGVPPAVVNAATFPSPQYPGVETPSEILSDPVTPAILECLASASEEPMPSGDDPNSAPGASAVAIDNKIEQAMDLVKSHLMFAVREEVEVLKEKISELMERISQLEAENGILRAAATQETLAALPPAPAPTPATHQPPQTNNTS